MKVKVVPGCIACGVCESICPEVFTVTDNSEVNPSGIDGHESACREAAEACPVSVIVVEE